MADLFNYEDSISQVGRIPSINVYGNNKFGEHVPKITIAIPTYKRAIVLKESLDSALSQNEFDDYHVIVVDNNPERDDETEQLMRLYSNHPKVTYYKNTENVGMAGNWNKCAVLSKSDFFLLLHDDDILSPFALKTFSVILSRIGDKWGLIKPNLTRFSQQSELIFNEPHNYNYVKLLNINYFCGDAIAAPSCVLVNKKVLLSVGGCHSQYYPCLDFVMSFQLNKRFCNYKSDDCNLGGYRVGENESLSVKTMNEFFINRTEIAYNIMSHYRIPKLLQKYLMAFSNRRTYDWVRKYYNMPDYYFDFRQMNLRINDIRTNIIGYIYIIILRVINRLNRIHIK